MLWVINIILSCNMMDDLRCWRGIVSNFFLPQMASSDVCEDGVGGVVLLRVYKKQNSISSCKSLTWRWCDFSVPLGNGLLCACGNAFGTCYFLCLTCYILRSQIMDNLGKRHRAGEKDKRGHLESIRIMQTWLQIWLCPLPAVKLREIGDPSEPVLSPTQWKQWHL